MNTPGWPGFRAWDRGPLLGGRVYERFGAFTLWTGTFAIGLALVAAYFALGRASSGRAGALETM